MNGTYYTITEVFDFGPHISKVILDYGKSMKGATISGAVYGTRYPYIHRGRGFCMVEFYGRQTR